VGVILDTNALSALAQKNRSLIDRLEDVEQLAVTIVSIGEYTFGIRQSNARSELEGWLREQLLTRVEVLFPDLSTVEYYADIRLELRQAGTPIPANDIWIAALVRQHAMPILSLDRHFDYVKNLTRIDW
jgi:tRNA(fMet)-specific endonuclease VapC